MRGGREISIHEVPRLSCFNALGTCFEKTFFASLCKELY
jgi:hypothetical protein